MAKISDTDLILNEDGSVYHLNLLPKHISDTIITVGDPSRVYRVSQYFDDVEFEMNQREFITHVGTYKGKKITVISTGIGTDNVEIFFTELDALVNIDLKTREPKSREREAEDHPHWHIRSVAGRHSTGVSPGQRICRRI